MKKVLTMLFAVGALSLSACQMDMHSADKTGAKMKEKGYDTQIYTYEEAKVAIQGLNYDAGKFNGAISSYKGSGDDKDILIAFFFDSADAAEKFMSYNENENLAISNRYIAANLGENLTAKIGIHNNVAYAGSETSFTVAFE